MTKAALRVSFFDRRDLHLCAQALLNSFLFDLGGLNRLEYTRMEHALFEEMESSGLNRQQITALEQLVGGTAATKSDLAEEASSLREDINRETSALRGALKDSVATMIKWFVGISLACAALNYAVLGFQLSYMGKSSESSQRFPDQSPLNLEKRIHWID